MAIYYLDDNLFQHKEMLKNVNNVLVGSCELSTEIYPFSKTNKMLDCIKHSNHSYNLYFLTLNHNDSGSSVFAAAKKIRQLEPHSMICFISSFDELALTSYEYNISAFAYIVRKSHTDYQKKVSECIVTYINNLKPKDNDIFFFESKYALISFPFREILYVSTISAHKVLIKTTTKDIHVYATLKKFQNLDPRLIRCHQSFYINITKIKYIDKSNRVALIANGLEIPISKKNNLIVQQTLSEYYQYPELFWERQ